MKFMMLAQLIQFLQEQFSISQDSIAASAKEAEDALDLVFLLHQRKAISFEQLDRACEWLCTGA
ncbi:MAG: DUF2949 domain-containing protein [Cyanobacteriota bacterium]|nr:DUF2949 domain-containing protein [Cyanobacteriota bacterium]